jgi:ATP-dependent Clp protease ATP-binding subunit ClpC
MTNIARILLSSLNKRLKERDINLKFTEGALKYLVEKGASSEYGARPLKRLIQTDIEDQLTDALLSGEISGHNIVVTTGENGLKFQTNTD